jgi:hypothetical protein
MPYEHDLSSVALLINMVATPMRAVNGEAGSKHRVGARLVVKLWFAADWRQVGRYPNEAVEQRKSLSGVRTSQWAYMWSLPAPDDVTPELQGQYGTL